MKLKRELENCIMILLRKLYILCLIFSFLFFPLFPSLISQSPLSIPYQAVIRNTDGSTMANAAVTITFKIHDNNATGTVVYEETHATTTNAQGLVSLNVGGGTAVTGTFSGIQWGSGSKFLQVLMNAGSGIVDLGTQQMMSVPYALYAEEVNVRVSVTGDSLFIGDQVSIVPGVSAANYLYQPGNGVTDIEGNFYPSIIINGQEWMQKNLAVSKYRNGDIITSVYDVINYDVFNVNTGLYGVYSDDIANNELYGKLYNFNCVIDSRGICPSNWHVPDSLEFSVLLSNFIYSSTELGQLKNQTGWETSNNASNNGSGFSGLPGGVIAGGDSMMKGSLGGWWSSSESWYINSGIAVVLYLSDSSLSPNFFGNGFSADHWYNQYSIRCIKD
jgi:uncharacterized protein (TIGR02145 family)